MPAPDSDAPQRGADPEESSEIVFVHPAPPAKATPVHGVRSTLVTSGLGVLRARGLYDRYLAALPPAQRDAIASTIAGAWLDCDFMLAHYQACDALGLTADEVRDIGRSIGTRINDTALQTLKRLAMSAGVTPWTAMQQYGRFWPRAFQGGGVLIKRAGPKDAVLTVSAVPFARSAYFRGTFTAIHETGLGLFCQKLYVRPVAGTLGEDRFAVRAAWV